MHMWMWFGYDLGEFLFPGLTISSRWSFALTWIALFFVALLYEGSKVYLARVQREAIKRLYPYRSDERRNLLCDREQGSMEPTTSRNATTGQVGGRWTSFRVRALVNAHQSFIFIVHNVVGYLLMLAVMVYNVHLLLAVVFGTMLGLKQPYAQQLKQSTPGEYYSLLVPDEIFEDIALQTNRFAEQTKLNIKPKSRAHAWNPITKDDIKQFFGLVLYMGLVKLPKLSLYWSKDKIFGQNFPRTVMSRNKFELILQKLHFTNNETADSSDRINKIRPLIESLNETFEKCYAPKENVCVDESLVPFRGRIIFRQYNKSKRHKYGMKLFKLCTLPGYTCKLQLYAGKNNELLNTTPCNVVLNLCQTILNKGHTVATDNWYTSLELANKLLDKDTHLVGTVRKNRKGLPKQVLESKLKPGESVAMENERGICVLKWKDKRDVHMLSTKHSNGFRTIMKKGRAVRKPKMIFAYNEAKSSVDMSDQMTSYSSPLRKNVKWYRKLGIELILNTAVVNAWVMYCENKKRKEGIVQFRRDLVEHFTNSGKRMDEPLKARPKRKKHNLVKKEGSVRNVRRFCVECYKTNSEMFGSKMAKNKTKKVATCCESCLGNPHFCLPCFNKLHH